MSASIVSDDCSADIAIYVGKWVHRGDGYNCAIESSMLRELFDIVEEEARHQRCEGFLKGRRSVLRKPRRRLGWWTDLVWSLMALLVWGGVLLAGYKPEPPLGSLPPGVVKVEFMPMPPRWFVVMGGAQFMLTGLLLYRSTRICISKWRREVHRQASKEGSST